ncbi:4-hydroxy-tetrahydrodipicolinate reductase [Pseudoroseicyclus aestuarii]|uniref:4-hydroxy-tetrahydrodipicolinate reductase n=1 Tax=Pseudoroseicyclus aestuarii TaxID=1795041 RepID=A0A318SR78_9RHOB|nr:4-hydroxy-tetrahydrodipicolinate reductase [Pseudoroseicyclus aestuarii]PYE83915.1 dihydrodipicolinate reductase [Pseudoroseicyclus aestuarii]
MDPEALPGVVVMGAAGRMGRMLARAVLDSPEARLAGAVVRPGHDWVGRDIGTLIGQGPAGVAVTDSPLDALAGAQAVLDFTGPATTVEMADLCAQARAVHVIGTTGLSEEDLRRLSLAARHAALVRAGNMSLGVNLLAGLTRRVAEALGTQWDIEIVEAHHAGKADAPSGTALMLGEAAAEGRGQSLPQVAARGRDGITGPRTPGSIGFAAVRGGDIVGEHDVIFAGQGERVVLRHMATDRMIFARGALRAALWGQGRPPGEYDMTDVLGL